MTALALFAISFGTCLATAAAAYRWIIRPLKQHDAQPTGSSISDDQIIAALTKWGDEQAALDRIRDEIKRQREEGT